MSIHHYGPLLGLAASLSLLAALLAGCSAARPPDTAAATGAPSAQAVAQQAADRDPLGTDETLWTWLGIAKRPAQSQIGPHTGSAVSPELWQATLDTLHFAGISADDPTTGLLVTKWYSPPNKPDERLQVTVFVLSRALRSDSVAVTVQRQVRSPAGQWQKTPVAREVVDGVDNAILRRAQQIHAARYDQTKYD